MAETAEIVLRFSDSGKLDRRLAVMAERVVDMRPAWARLRARFVAAETRVFARQGGASGPWMPLSPSYGAWKMAHYPGKSILRRTDRLFHSLTDGLAVDIEEPHMAVFGTDVAYGGYHQRGAHRLPRRPFIDFTETERRTWVQIIADHITADNADARAGAI